MESTALDEHGMYAWQNHDGTQPADDEEFPPIPEGIGHVVSATTNVRAGRVVARSGAFVLLFLSIVFGPLPIAFLVWTVTLVVDLGAYYWYAQVALPVAAFAVALLVLRRLDGTPRCTFVGEEGIATVEAGRVSVFRFEDATEHRKEIVEQHVKGVLTGLVAEHTWLDESGGLVHRERGSVPLPVHAHPLPSQAPVFFLDAAARAWERHRDRREAHVSSRDGRQA